MKGTALMKIRNEHHNATSKQSAAFKALASAQANVKLLQVSSDMFFGNSQLAVWEMKKTQLEVKNTRQGQKSILQLQKQHKKRLRMLLNRMMKLEMLCMSCLLRPVSMEC